MICNRYEDPNCFEDGSTGYPISYFKSDKYTKLKKWVNVPTTLEFLFYFISFMMTPLRGLISNSQIKNVEVLHFIRFYNFQILINDVHIIKLEPFSLSSHSLSLTPIL